MSVAVELAKGVECYRGDALEVLRTLPSESVNCLVTSPPYWGLRDYGVKGQLGLEDTPQEYIAKMVEVFAEVRRVLRVDGTLWLNMGDSYNGQGARSPNIQGNGDLSYRAGGRAIDVAWMKPKDLCGIPWMLAFALRADGWYLRSDIIWHKPNPMPESVTDRPTKSHEYIFLLSKNERYYYDAEAIKEESVTDDTRRPYGSQGAWDMDGRPAEQRHGGEQRTIKMPDGWDTGPGGHGSFHRNGRQKGKTHGRNSRMEVDRDPAHLNRRPKAWDLDMGSNRTLVAGHARKMQTGKVHGNLPGRSDEGAACNSPDQITRNKRSVWTVATQSFSEAHFATFPEELIKPCILAGCPAGGTVLDPFGGSGTTALVARAQNCKAILIELNPVYIEIARRRLKQEVLEFGL